jgi:predicted nucleic acid-binding protein
VADVRRCARWTQDHAGANAGCRAYGGGAKRARATLAQNMICDTTFLSDLLRQRLGENDNWIAGFCRYYAQPIVSRDGAFDRVRGLRRLDY